MAVVAVAQMKAVMAIVPTKNNRMIPKIIERLDCNISGLFIVKQQGSRDPATIFDCVVGWGSYFVTRRKTHETAI